MHYTGRNQQITFQLQQVKRPAFLRHGFLHPSWLFWFGILYNKMSHDFIQTHSMKICPAIISVCPPSCNRKFLTPHNSVEAKAALRIVCATNLFCARCLNLLPRVALQLCFNHPRRSLCHWGRLSSLSHRYSGCHWRTFVRKWDHGLVAQLKEKRSPGVGLRISGFQLPALARVLLFHSFLPDHTALA